MISSCLRPHSSGWQCLQASQLVIPLAARTELLLALPAMLFLLFPTHDPSAGLLALGGSKPLHKVIRLLRMHPAVLAFGEVPAATMALMQHSPYLVTLGEHSPKGHADRGDVLCVMTRARRLSFW